MITGAKLFIPSVTCGSCGWRGVNFTIYLDGSDFVETPDGGKLKATIACPFCDHAIRFGPGMQISLRRTEDETT